MKTKVYKGIPEDEALQLASKEFGISEGLFQPVCSTFIWISIK